MKTPAGWFLVAVTVTSAVIRADTLTYTEIPESGRYSYDFTLTNSGDTGGTLYDLFLSIPVDISEIDATTIAPPVGWGDAAGGLVFFGPDMSPGTSFIEWSDDPSGAYDIKVGGLLGGFSFASLSEIEGPILFALNGSTTLVSASPAANTPEPSYLWLCVLGLTTLRLHHWKIRK